MRHEQFNGMLKEYSTLSDMFRHDQDLFEICFEAAAVICQCRMEHGEPLWDVLAGVRFVENGETLFDVPVKEIEERAEKMAEQCMNREE